MNYIIGNWKMNLSLREAQNLTKGLLTFLENFDSSSFHCMVCPSFPFLVPLYEILRQNLQSPSLLSLVAQDVSAHPKGAFTGEVSASQLQGCGARAVLIGHSERRLYHKETSEILLQKIKECCSQELIPIICLGEPLDIRSTSQTLPFVLEQLKEVTPPLLASFSKNPSFPPSFPPFMIAYEPLWAIGTGLTPTLEEIENVHSGLKTALALLFPTWSIPVLYGGSVTPEISADILSLPSVGGALVGGASLSLESFLPILKSFCNTGASSHAS